MVRTTGKKGVLMSKPIYSIWVIKSRIFNNPKRYYISLILACIPLILFAQIYEVDTIFVTASRVEEPINRIPLHTFLINRDIISLRNFGDIGSVLNNLPGIDIRTYSIIGGTISWSLLGSSSQQVLVLLDGRPMNSPNLGMADLSLLPTDNLKRVEIVNGPISSLYGANALGGVVNFVTRSPLDFTTPGTYYDVSLLYGTYQTNRINLGTGIASNHFAFLINANDVNTQGNRTNDECWKQGLDVKLGYHNQSLSAQIDFGGSTKTKGLPGPKPAPTSIPSYGDSTASSIFDRTCDTSFLVNGKLDFRRNEQFSLQLLPNYTRNMTHFLWVDPYSVDTALYQDYYTTQVFSTSLIANYQSRTGIRINGGIDFKHDGCRSRSFIYDEVSFGYKDTTWRVKVHRLGVFGESNIPLGKYVILVPSFRWDWNSDFGDFLSPSFGLLFPLNSQIRIRTHIGRAFRAPTFNDLFWPKSGNPEIKPEYGDALQLGIDSENEVGSFSITGFTRKTKNLISWVPDTAGLWRPTNIDEAVIFGFTTNGKIRLAKGFSFHYTWDWSKAVQLRQEVVYYDWLTQKTQFERIKRRAAYRPEFSATQEIGYETNFATYLGLELREIGNRVNYYPMYDSLPKVYMASKTLPFSFVVNLRIRQNLFTNTKLILRIENLLNQNYAEQFGNSIFDLDYPKPKRTIFFELRANNF